MRGESQFLVALTALAVAACGGSGLAAGNAEPPAEPVTDVAGEVLGTPIYTQDAEELRYYVLRGLTDRYAADKEIVVTEAEKTAFVEHVRATLSRDPNFAGPGLVAEESAEEQAAREQIAAAFILQWKINRALYEQYGGRIIYQQGGPEPLDAYRKFLDESAARGDFAIVNGDLEAGFWRYYRDESIHDFLQPGSAEEARAFADPPWLSNQTR